MIGDFSAELGEARITDIATRIGGTHPTSTKTVARLKLEGLAFSRPYRGVILTEAREALDTRVGARHRTVVDLLIAVGVPHETAWLDAEGMEHQVSEATPAASTDFIAREG